MKNMNKCSICGEPSKYIIREIMQIFPYLRLYACEEIGYKKSMIDSGLKFLKNSFWVVPTKYGHYKINLEGGKQAKL